MATLLWRVPGSGQQQWFDTALFASMTALAQIYRVQLAPGTHVSVDTAAVFAAALILPPHLAAIAVLAGLLLAAAVRRGILLHQSFNVSAELLVTLVGAWIATAFLPDRFHAVPDLEFVAAAVPTIVAMWVANAFLIDCVIAVQRRRRLFEGWWAVHRRGIWQEGSLYLLGLLVATVALADPWTSALLIVPTVVVYRSLRDGVALMFQTRRALEEVADVVDYRDRYTHQHMQRVADMARDLARSLRLPAAEVELVYQAGRVHDIGKIGIKSTVLMKPGKLTDVEWQEMRSHPEVGARLVATFPEFARGREVVLSHHERWDGTGYPRGLAGEQIPLGARIIAVVDTWDAMTSSRAYRRALDISVAMKEMERGRGKQFEPRLLDAFVALLRQRPELMQKHEEEVQDVDLGVAQAHSA
jgi:HD-GYP domain-containing protein (c-di-GMP phosphodiesterase class II)